MKPINQKQALIKLLSTKKWISAADAFIHTGSIKLATRVGELGKHFTIESRWQKSKTRFGTKLQFKQYRIVKDEFYKQGLEFYFN
jgi:flagellar biosynthesis/type III secretory pathway protein FliH